MRSEAGGKLKLNLGCGHRRLPGFLNVDSQPGCAPDCVVDLEQTPWPWEDNSVDEVALIHVLEHLGQSPAVYLNVIKELWRVCCDGARIHIAVPHPRSDEYLNDPTHVRPVTADGLLMFSQKANDEWAAAGAANTPLGRYLGVDFEIDAIRMDLAPHWLARFQAGEVSEAEIVDAGLSQFNVYSQMSLEWRTVKASASVPAVAGGAAEDWQLALQRAWEAGDLEQAFAVLQDVLTRRPGDGEALAQLAAMQHVLGDAEGALLTYRQAAAKHEFGWEFFNNYGALALDLGLQEEAAEALRQAASLAPSERSVRLNRAELAGLTGDIPGALGLYEALLAEFPRDAEICLGMARLFNGQGWFADAVRTADMARSLGVEDAEMLNQRGIACRELGHFEAALGAFADALALAPDSIALMLNVANALARLARPDEAEALYREAIAACGDNPPPDLTLAYACFLLKQGRTDEGWPYYEQRRAAAGVRQHELEAALPRWQGEAVENGRLLVVAEQGFGDNLQFAALLPRVREYFPYITLQTRPALTRLLSRSLGDVCQVVDQLPADATFDRICPVASLPAVLKLAVESWTLPAYLKADPMQTALWGFRIPASTQKKVGLCWRGGKAERYRQRCDLPVDEVERLIGHSGLRWLSLQKDGDEAWRQAEVSAGRLLDLMNMVSSFDDTAALLGNLDLVITVDTSVAHLAAGLGKPVWLLLANDADWRWLDGRADCPWYPSLRIFRQASPGQWSGLVDDVLGALEAL